MTDLDGAGPGLRQTLFRAAAAIAVITVVARLAGFLRTFVFARAVGSGCVGVVYQTANTVPNIVFDIVAGGTLTALVVPLVAPHLSVGDRRTAGRTVSALLTWTAVVLTAVAAIVILLAGPITRLLLGPQPCSGANELAQRMLVVFAPQIVLYGFAVVLAGTLQAAERFSWPALAPLVSSLVVISAYLAFGVMRSGDGSASSLPTSSELILSIGTTLGVLVLAGSQLPAALRLRQGLRPTLRFPTGIAQFVRRAALAGAITLIAQQLATAVMLRLANGGIPGTLVVLTIAQTVYLLPWAVLAVPVATALFPRMSASWDSDQCRHAAEIAETGLRVTAVLGAFGTAALVAAAGPIANVLQDRHQDAHSVFGPAIAAFAVGLIGWSIVALLARVLYAARRPQLAAVGQAVGWTVTVAIDLVAAYRLPRHDRAVALALGNAVGVSVAAGLLIVIALRLGALGPLGPILRSVAVAAFAAGIGSLSGWTVGRSASSSGVLASIAIGAASALAAVAIAAAVLALLDRTTLGLIRKVIRHG